MASQRQASSITNRGQKFNLSSRNYEWNLERMSISSQSTCPTGQVLWEELLQEVILLITPLCSLLHTLLKDKRTNANCKSLIRQDRCDIEIFLSPVPQIVDCFNSLHAGLGKLACFFFICWFFNKRGFKKFFQEYDQDILCLILVQTVCKGHQ